MKYITTVGEKQFLVEIIDDRHVSVDGKVYEVDFESVSGQPVYSLIVDGKSHEFVCCAWETNWQVLLRGRLYPVAVVDEREMTFTRRGRQRCGRDRRVPSQIAHARACGRHPY